MMMLSGRILAWLILLLVLPTILVAQEKLAVEGVVAPTTPMQLIILDESEKPVPNAKIHLSIWSDPMNFPNRDFVADQDGIVQFDRPKQLQVLRVWASKEKHVPIFTHWELNTHDGGKDIPAEVTITLPKGHRIGGFVFGEDGNPISGVRLKVAVEIRTEKQTCISRWLAEDDNEAVTDHEGHWIIDNAPAKPDDTPDFHFSLFLTHPDFISDSSWRTHISDVHLITDLLRNEDAECYMERGVRIKGIVKSLDGKPVEDGIVVWGGNPYGTDGSQEVRIEKTGTFVVPPLKAGTCVLTAVATGNAPTMFEVELQADRELTLVLDPPNKLAFNVVDPGGAPIPHAQVAITSWRKLKSLYNHKHPNVLDSKIPRSCDELGTFTWSWAPADEVKIRAYAKGYVEADAVISSQADDQEIVLKRAADK